MLASTVQFSTYNQTPVTRPHRTQHTPRGTWRYEMQTGPAETKRLPAPSGPNSVPTNQTPHPDSAPRTPEGMQYWEPATRAGRTGQRSTLEHHPGRVRPVEIDGPS